MNLDDRDIIEQTDWSRYTALATVMDAMYTALEQARIERDTAQARVAELEAAQRWRPVTDDWPHYHDRVVIGHYGGTWSACARRTQNDDGDDEWLVDDGRILDHESAAVALAIPPLPAPPQEPTP